jgi:hypothetical protein
MPQRPRAEPSAAGTTASRRRFVAFDSSRDSGLNGRAGPGSSATAFTNPKASRTTGGMPSRFTRWTSSAGRWYWSCSPVWNITVGIFAAMNG